MDPHNYLERILKPAARSVGIKDITFQALRRTFATQVQPFGTVKDSQTQLRHADANTTMNIYAQAIPESVRAAVEGLDQKISDELNTTGRCDDL